ncbi:MAG: hypothetical protein HY840_09785, partial [Bacteroidetes bacterium]|nr:hypothetical protein [Bacteroidota bacterium]
MNSNDSLLIIYDAFIIGDYYYIKIPGLSSTTFNLCVFKSGKEANVIKPHFTCNFPSCFNNKFQNGHLYNVTSSDFSTPSAPSSSAIFHSHYDWIWNPYTSNSQILEHIYVLHGSNFPPSVSDFGHAYNPKWTAQSPDGDNWFLICDGEHDLTESEIISQDITGINNGTTYYFSFFIKNIHRELPSDPYYYVTQISTFQVRINGNPIPLTYTLGSSTTYTTNSVKLPRSNDPTDWVKVCGSWTPSNLTSSTINFGIWDVTDNPSEFGNDFGIDDILFGNAGNPYTVSYPIINVCLNTPLTLTPADWNSSGCIWSTGYTGCYLYLQNNLIGTFYYTVSSIDEYGCSVTTQYTVKVHPNPTVTTNTPPPVCSGDDVILIATASGGTSPYSYHWNGGMVGSPIIVNPTSTITTTVTYNVYVSDFYGCPANGSVQVTVNPLPSVALNTPSICSGLGTAITDANHSQNISCTYVWSNGWLSYPGATGPLSCTPPSSNPCVIPYSVIVTNPATSCSTTATTTVQVYQIPTATVSLQSPICSGSQANIAPYSDVTGTTYSWTYTQVGVIGATTGSGSIINDVLYT